MKADENNNNYGVKASENNSLVMDQLRQKQSRRRIAKAEALFRRNFSSLPSSAPLQMMTSATVDSHYRDRLAANWSGEYTLLAFLFAMPNEPTIEELRQRGEYFDHRSGQTWDLYFPGYFGSASSPGAEIASPTAPYNGDASTYGLQFSTWHFNHLRGHVESSSENRWQFSGGSDLVLINAYVPEHGEPIIDWESTLSGTIEPPHTLAQIIEKISRDFEQGNEDPAYGVGSITNPPSPHSSTAAGALTRDFIIQALAGVAASLGFDALGF